MATISESGGLTGRFAVAEAGMTPIFDAHHEPAAGMAEAVGGGILTGKIVAEREGFEPSVPL
jgi:hypothetical protein